MKKSLFVLLTLGAILFASETINSSIVLPDLKMKDNNLTFKEIEGYENYRIVATHFRKDKNELRYILANPIAYTAMKQGVKIMPEGSILVKIAWKVQEMALFPSAIKASSTIPRVEYMIKDSKRFNHEGDHWGYARFVKKTNGTYKTWDKGVQGCIACHQSTKEHDYLFSEYQKVF